jgi:hypothetical protein
MASDTAAVPGVVWHGEGHTLWAVNLPLDSTRMYYTRLAITLLRDYKHTKHRCTQKWSG